MKEGFDIFKDQIDLSQYAMSGYLGVLVFTLIGIVITTILQSSSATLALILTALAIGQIEYGNALALAIGANIGTTITAILGSISANVAGKRLALAHLTFNIITGFVTIIFIFQLAGIVDVLSEKFGIGKTDYTLKLALFHTLFNVIGVVIMIPFIKKLEKWLIKTIKDKKNDKIYEPQFLTEAVLDMPDSAIEALVNESKFLFKNAIFEIVAHALNIHRADIKSDVKIKKIIKETNENIPIDVEEVYYRKVKVIYGEIIKYATITQNNNDISIAQNEALTDIKVANRKMIEIIKDARELNKNVTFYTKDNKYMHKSYEGYRKKIGKVLRAIYLFRKSDNPNLYIKKLEKLRVEAKTNRRLGNDTIHEFISKDKITSEMASSLFNDSSNVNDMTKKMIEIAELLYGEKDLILEGS